MTTSRRTTIRQQLLPALGGGLVYGSACGIQGFLLGWELLWCFLLGLLGALLWAGATLVVLGPLTRWRDRRASRDWPTVKDGEKEG